MTSAWACWAKRVVFVCGAKPSSPTRRNSINCSARLRACRNRITTTAASLLARIRVPRHRHGSHPLAGVEEGLGRRYALPMNELEMFLSAWDREAENTLKLLRALPVTQYDFRPDKDGRSLGELAWHLAEGDAYMSYGVETGSFSMGAKPPNIERPRTVEALAPGYERVHREAVARIRKLTPQDLDRTLQFFVGEMTIRDILWAAILSHGIHHRGQLSLMCRLAGGQAPGLYGPNREEMAAMRTTAS